jgi:ABC-type thiamine transport system ATPase subunit
VTSGLSREAYGGAVTTVQSVLLRIIVLLKRGLRPILIMDESLPAFDSTYVDNMGLFLKTICARLGIDILLVSHNPAMVEAADRAYRIQKINGAAVFRKIR